MDNFNAMKKTFFIAIGIAFITIVIPVGFYFCKFHSGFSNNPSDWSAFGSYASPFFSLAYTILIALLTYWLIRIEMARDKPVLVIVRLKPTLDVYNIGKAQAVNVRVVSTFNDKQEDTQKLPHPHLVPTDSFGFNPPPNGATCVVVRYESIHGEKFEAAPNQTLFNSFGFVLTKEEAKG